MTYRIYFNRWNEFPLIWSVDDGSQDTEKNVAQVVLEGIEGRTMSGKGDNVNSPTVWIEARGTLTIKDGIATIRRAAERVLRTAASKHRRKAGGGSRNAFAGSRKVNA